MTLALAVSLSAFTGPLDKASRDADKRFKKMARDAEAFGRGLGSAVKLAGAATAAFLGLYLKNSIEAEKVTAQLASRIKDTAGAAGRSLEQLKAQADKLQGLSIFDDESVMDAQAMLLTFKEIKGVVFDETIESALDLATVMGTDAASAAKILGKALSDPEKGLAALRKAGILFTDAEKERIKTMQEAGDIAGAQTEILKKLEGSMGTAAEAARNTLGGALTGLKNTFENLLEGDTSKGGLKGTVDAVNALNDSMQDPALKIGLTNVDRETAIQLRGQDAESIAKYGEEIRAANQKIADDLELVETANLVGDSFGDAFESIIAESRLAGTAFGDFASSVVADLIRIWIQKKLTGLFTGGTDVGAGTTDWGAFTPNMGGYGGGLASGGSALPGMFYRVNENGPEMLSVAGKDYVMMGSQGGMVTPNAGGGAGRSITVPQNFYTMGLETRRTQERKAQLAGRAAQRAMARNGR